MGTDYSKLPPAIEAMKPTEKAPSVEVEYCGAWGGLKEAQYTERIIKHVFPKATVKTHTPGKTNNLIVRIDGKVVFEKKTNGKMDEKNAQEMIRQLETLSKWAEMKWRKGKMNKMKFLRKTWILKAKKFWFHLFILFDLFNERRSNDLKNKIV